MMDYRLQVFRCVAECESITKAAHKLHLSQPAVTKHIQLLEEGLGVPLFVRSAKGMLLTEGGLVYLEHVQQIAQAHETVAQRLRAPAGILHGRLRLGSNKTILSYYLPAILARFKRAFPAITCEVIDGNTDTIVGALLDQRIDLALIEGPCERSEVQRKTFLEDEIVWVAEPSHPLACVGKVTPKTLLQYPLVVRETGAGTRQFMESALRRLKIDVGRLQIVQEVPSPEAVKRLVAAGTGIGYIFRLGVEQELSAGLLRKIPCAALTIRRPFSVLFQRGPIPSGVGQAFMRLLLEAE
jgi:DNA-binding transcriptional LysR family regulator